MKRLTAIDYKLRERNKRTAMRRRMQRENYLKSIKEGKLK